MKYYTLSTLRYAWHAFLLISLLAATGFVVAIAFIIHPALGIAVLIVACSLTIGAALASQDNHWLDP